MTILTVGLSTSVDGFVADADGEFGMLYSDLGTPAWEAYLEADIARTGAAVIGRRMFDLSPDMDDYAVDYEYQVPIFVVTHQVPERVPASNDRLSITFVTDGVASAIALARAAAGEREVRCLGGPDLMDQVVTLDLADELQVDVMPLILGSGRRLLEGVDRRIDLDLIAVREAGPRTSLRYAIRR